jgi:transcriptional regulator with XRE-family HTH domain
MIDIDRITKELNLLQKDLAVVLGVTSQAISKVKSGEMSFPEAWKDTLMSKYGLDIENYKREVTNTDTVTTPKYTNGIAPIKLTLREVPLINRYAYASFVEHFNDQEFLESMETIPTTQLEDGNYLWFEVKGDSMSREEYPSIEERDQILGRELYKTHWKALQLKRAKIWIINHIDKGLLIKEIIKQSTDGHITCHSWNPLVPTFDVHLDDINQLFYAKELRKKFI